METRAEVREFIEEKKIAIGEVKNLYFYNHGFRFFTDEQGWKLFDFEGVDLIGEKAKGRVIDGHIYPNGFEFFTNEQGWKLFDLEGVDLIGDKAIGKVIACQLYDNGFKFETAEQGYKLFDLQGVDLIGEKADGKVTWCQPYPNFLKFLTKKQGIVTVEFEKKLNEEAIKNLCFNFIEEYKHDEFVTRQFTKGLISAEFTYKGDELQTFDITIDEVVSLKVNEDELMQLDKILNK